MPVRLAVCLCLVVALAACGGGTSAADLDAAEVREGCGPTADAGTAAEVTYAAITIRDRSPAAAPVNGVCDPRPGMDLDCVGLYRNGSLIAVGLSSATTPAIFEPAANAPCANPHAVTASAAGPLDGHVFADTTQDSGYLSLNGGSLRIQFAACTVSTSNITNCDGAGDWVAIRSGDEIDVWQIDQNYLTESRTAAEGNAWAGCTCAPDAYEVDLLRDLANPTQQVVLPTFCEANSPTGNWYFGSHTVVVP
jgi:hypothetical protein